LQTPPVRHPQVPSERQQLGAWPQPEQPGSFGQSVGPPSAVDPPPSPPLDPVDPELPELPAPELDVDPKPPSHTPAAHMSPVIVQSTQAPPARPHAMF
jgi:hypothetical protein